MVFALVLSRLVTRPGSGLKVDAAFGSGFSSGTGMGLAKIKREFKGSRPTI